MEATLNQESINLMETLDPALIHKVLLTDPEDFSSLASSAKTRFTMSFDEFWECMDNNHPDDDMEHDMVIKKAVRDHIASVLAQRPDHLEPITSLLCELHQQIRALIPNRHDLHSILNDNEAHAASTLDDLRPLVIKAARSLVQLESESRETTTVSLLDQLQQVSHNNDNNSIKNKNNKDPLFWLNVIFYLIYKAELCQADKQDFYLVNVWAPRIHIEGPAFEKAQYQKQYGNFSDPNSSPITRQWIHDLVQSHLAANPQSQPEDPSCNSVESIVLQDRKALLRAGWVEDIVFRASNQKALKLPEIFARDHQGLHTLREMTRLAVAGCALALQACTVAGVQQQLLSNPECTSRERKLSLLRAMKCRGVPAALYEKNVVDEVKQLAREWSIHFGNQQIREEALQQLGWRVGAVLRGQDPVLKLLDSRAKKTVCDVLVNNLNTRTDDGIVAEMHTGLRSPCEPLNDNTEHSNNKIMPIVEKLFCQRGLAFFASELAIVSKLAGKIVDLAIDLYWDDFLDDLFLNASNSDKHARYIAPQPTLLSN